MATAESVAIRHAIAAERQADAAESIEARLARIEVMQSEILDILTRPAPEPAPPKAE